MYSEIYPFQTSTTKGPTVTGCESSERFLIFKKQLLCNAAQEKKIG
jgi:hypothetical protein